MELITLKQFAEQKGISYEAVRRQVTRYATELRGHIITKDGTRFLDPEAVALLSDRRRLSPIVTVVEDQGGKIADLQAEIEELKKQIEDLKARLLATQDQLNKAREEIVVEQAARIADQQKIILLQEEAKAAIEDKAARVTAEARTADLQQQHDADQDEISRLRSEVDSFERTWFGLYKKKK